MTPIKFSTLKFSTSLWFSLFGRRWLFLFTGKSLPLFGRWIIQLHHLSSPPTSTGHHLLRQGSGGEHEFGKTRRRHLSSHPFSTFPISLPSTDHRPPSTVGLRRGAGICQRQALNCYLSLLHMHIHTHTFYVTWHGRCWLDLWRRRWWGSGSIPARLRILATLIKSSKLNY